MRTREQLMRSVSSRLHKTKSNESDRSSRSNRNSTSSTNLQSPKPSLDLKSSPLATKAVSATSTVKLVNKSEDEHDTVSPLPETPKPKSKDPLAKQLSQISLGGIAYDKGDAEGEAAYKNKVANEMNHSQSTPAMSHTSNFQSSDSLQVDRGRARTNGDMNALPVPERQPSDYSRQFPRVRQLSANYQSRESGLDEIAASNGTPDSNTFDSSIGKAGLGKSGRVIEKLQSEIASLKRAAGSNELMMEEIRRAADLEREKNDGLIEANEQLLRDRNTERLGVQRRDRQIETLKAQVQQERNRADHYQESEKTWKAKLDKVEAEAKIQVEEAKNRALLAEGRYNAIANHWPQQGVAVERTIAKHKVEMNKVMARLDEVTLISKKLEAVCVEKDKQFVDVLDQKNNMAQLLQDYKNATEASIANIKTTFAAQEAKNERVNKELTENNDKLKWAINVKNNISWAK